MIEAVGLRVAGLLRLKPLGTTPEGSTVEDTSKELRRDNVFRKKLLVVVEGWA